MLRYLILFIYLLFPFNGFAQSQSSNFCEEHNVVPLEGVFDSPIRDVFTGPATDSEESVVLVWAQSNIIYRSMDGGKTWEQPNAEMSIARIVISPIDKSHMLLLGSDGTHWITKDAGWSISKLITDHDFIRAAFHPSLEGHILALAASDCESSVSGSCSHDLYLTRDFGETWKLVVRYVIQFAFLKEDPSSSALPSDTILLISYPTKSGDMRTKNPDTALLYRYTMLDSPMEERSFDDVLVLSNVPGFFISNRFVFVSQHNEMEGAYRLFISGDYGMSFERAVFPPSVTLQHHGYTVIETSNSGGVFLQVQHDSGGKWGHMYQSDSSGLRYALSLERTRRNAGTGHAEFSKVSGIDGIYFVNTFDPDTQDITTWITYDRGAKWEHVLAPPESSSECTDCSLHLHLKKIKGKSNRKFTPPVTNPKAVGIVLASGSIGTFLSDDSNMYMSRDGGLAFKMVQQGNARFAVSDHGNIIIIAGVQEVSSGNRVKFSLDEGLNWHECPTELDSINVQEIKNIPKSLDFYIMGTREVEDKTKGVLIYYDMSQLFDRECTGMDNPGTPTSDYEKWKFHSPASYCHLGSVSTYFRKKADTNPCVSDSSADVVFSTDVCTCSSADYECDVCYIADRHNSKCVSYCSDRESLMETQCMTSNQYFNVSGYRKIPGDVCGGPGVPELEPKLVDCPFDFRNPHHGKKGGRWLWLLLAPTGVLTLTVFCYFLVLPCMKRHGKIENLQRDLWKKRWSDRVGNIQRQNQWAPDEDWSRIFVRFYRFIQRIGVRNNRFVPLNESDDHSDGNDEANDSHSLEYGSGVGEKAYIRPSTRTKIDSITISNDRLMKRKNSIGSDVELNDLNEDEEEKIDSVLDTELM